MTEIFGHGEAFDIFALGTPIVLIAIVAFLRSQGRVAGFDGDLQHVDRSGEPCHL